MWYVAHNSGCHKHNYSPGKLAYKHSERHPIGANGNYNEYPCPYGDEYPDTDTHRDRLLYAFANQYGHWHSYLYTSTDQYPAPNQYAGGADKHACASCA